jgi:uncharacterized membrane protein (UPF0127 family)
MPLQAMNVTRQCPLITRGEQATNFFTRFRGLIGHRPLQEGEGLMIAPCQGVHTFLMRFPIDVVHVGADNRVVRLVPNLPPNRFGPVDFKTRFVLELPAGTIARTGTAPGDQVEVREARKHDDQRIR